MPKRLVLADDNAGYLSIHEGPEVDWQPEILRDWAAPRRSYSEGAYNWEALQLGERSGIVSVFGDHYAIASASFRFVHCRIRTFKQCFLAFTFS